MLGVPREATQDGIRKAHRKLVRKYHPDANPGNHSSEEHFRAVQRAYEVLSNPEKRREYDKSLGTSTGRSSGKPRARASRKTGGESAAPPADLSDLLRKLTDLSGDRSDGRKEGSFQLRLTKLVGENMKMNAKANLGDARSGRYRPTGERVSGGKQSGASNELRDKKVQGPKAQRKEKRVRGPKAQRRRKER